MTEADNKGNNNIHAPRAKSGSESNIYRALELATWEGTIIISAKKGHQNVLTKECKIKGINLQAYSPLGSSTVSRPEKKTIHARPN